MDTIERYKRQLDIDDWGTTIQEKLADSKVCVAGVGGLGSPVSLYLAAAGVGTIVLCDYQTVELSNLNRQVLYTENDIGSAKIEKARERLRALNSDISVEISVGRISDDNAPSIFAGADIIIDCLDNFDTRYVLNRYSIASGTPLVHAGITSFYGQLALIHPPFTPCLECIIPPESIQKVKAPPVLGATAGVVGSLQAAEAIKVLGGMPEAGYRYLRSIDILNMSFESIAIERRPSCLACG